MTQTINYPSDVITTEDRLGAVFCDQKFYKFPQVLLTKGRLFRGLSLEAKTLYMLIRDRQELAYKLNDPEPDGRCPVYFTIQEVMDTFQCGNKKAVRIFRELEEWDMIERVRQGMNRASKIYAKPLKVKIYPQDLSD